MPLGDEAGYISSAMSLVKNRDFDPNAYHMTYFMLLKFVTPDPIKAHVICRVFSSMLSIVLMYLFLSGVFLIAQNHNTVLVTTAFWAASRLNVPEIQFANINLFTLNMVFPALILIMHKLSLNRLLFLLISLLWAAQVRMEYYAPLLLTFIFTIVFLIFKFKKSGMTFSGIRQKYIFLLLVFIGIFSIVLIKSTKHKSFNELDKHLLLGLEQCYTSLYSKLNPEKKISTMVEYKNISDEVFKSPTGFLDACKKNPSEVIKYLALNGTINSFLLVPGLLRHRSLIIPEKYGKKGEAVQIFIILITIAFGFYLKLKDTSIGYFCQILLKNYRIWILLILCSASIVSLFLHIPDPRYWISCIPLLFTGITFSIDALLKKIKSKKAKLTISIISVFVFMHPLFLNHKSNQFLIRSMQNEWKDKTTQPIVAGLYPTALATYSFGLNCKVISVPDFDVNEILTQGYDFISVDQYFRNSSYYNANLQVLSDFETNPKKYGYKNLGTTNDKYQMTVYAKIYSSAVNLNKLNM